MEHPHRFFFWSKVFIIIFFINIKTIKSQDFGSDIMSSYVWRGTQFGGGAHIQPWMELNFGSFTGGFWGSFPTTNNGGGNELDLYLSYSFKNYETKEKFLEFTLTNYSFPLENGTYKPGEGLFETNYFEVSGLVKLGPVNLMLGYFTKIKSLYIETSFSTGPIEFGFGYGYDSKTPFYVNGESGLCSLSVNGSKEIKFTDDFSLPVSSSFVYNPQSEAAFLVFGMSF